MSVQVASCACADLLCQQPALLAEGDYSPSWYSLLVVSVMYLIAYPTGLRWSGSLQDLPTSCVIPV